MLLRTIALSLALALPAYAFDVESGPKVGSKLASFKAHDCTGDDAGKNIDHVAARKDKVTVFLFVAADKFSRPMNRFMKVLDGKLGEKGLEGVNSVAVWLTDNDKTTREFLPRVQTSVKYENTTLCSYKGVDGPNGWDINTDAHLTVVVTAKNKVAARFAYQSVNDADVPAVLKELKKHAAPPKKGK